MKWFLFYPELYYFAAGMVFLGLSMVKQANPRRDYYTAMSLAALGVLICLLNYQAGRTSLFTSLPGGPILAGF